MEKLLKKDAKFQWKPACQEILDKLKNKMATVPILVFFDWKKEFHVHVDALFVSLNIVLTQLGEGALDHPIFFASKKLSMTKKTTRRRKEKALLWSMRSKILDTICWVDISRCILIIER